MKTFRPSPVRSSPATIKGDTILFSDLLANRVLWIAVAAWAAAQILKALFDGIRRKGFSIERLFGAGGMPSSHSSTVCGLTTGIARIYGLDSPLFTLSLVVACIVMYDATGVRRAAGEHAKLLNQLLFSDPEKLTPSQKALKEFLGHTPLEVLAGAALGILIGCIMPV